MSITYIQLSDPEFKSIINSAMIEGAKLAREVLHKGEDQDDIITQDEALRLIGCGPSKLANLRTERKVKYYTTSRPYTYSRKSVMAYVDSMAI